MINEQWRPLVADVVHRCQERQEVWGGEMVIMQASKKGRVKQATLLLSALHWLLNPLSVTVTRLRVGSCDIKQKNIYEDVV